MFDGRIKELNGFKLSINRVKRQSETIFSGNGSTPVIVRIKFAKLCRVYQKDKHIYVYIRVYIYAFRHRSSRRPPLTP